MQTRKKQNENRYSKYSNWVLKIRVILSKNDIYKVLILYEVSLCLKKLIGFNIFQLGVESKATFGSSKDSGLDHLWDIIELIAL